MSAKMNRRQLFGTGAMAGAALFLPQVAAAATPCAATPKKWDFEADVVVIGAGGLRHGVRDPRGRSGCRRPCCRHQL